MAPLQPTQAPTTPRPRPTPMARKPDPELIARFLNTPGGGRYAGNSSAIMPGYRGLANTKASVPKDTRKVAEGRVTKNAHQRRRLPMQRANGRAAARTEKMLVRWSTEVFEEERREEEDEKRQIAEIEAMLEEPEIDELVNNIAQTLARATLDGSRDSQVTLRHNQKIKVDDFIAKLTYQISGVRIEENEEARKLHIFKPAMLKVPEPKKVDRETGEASTAKILDREEEDKIE